MQHKVKVLSTAPVTHDVVQVVTEKPAAYDFKPGQATDVAVDKEGWRDELRPFTFTCLPEDDHIEFTIKTYPSHKGVTNQVLQLKKEDGLILHDVFGDIAYKGEGVFIAGGAGVTPFIAIFRHLHEENKVGNNKLIFANKTKADIIREEEFKNLLGDNFINILSEEETAGYAHGHITKEFLQKYLPKGAHVYLCGPPPMMDAILKMLKELGVEESLVVKEAF